MPLIITLSAIYFPLNDPLITGIVTVISSLIKVVFSVGIPLTPWSGLSIVVKIVSPDISKLKTSRNSMPTFNLPIHLPAISDGIVCAFNADKMKIKKVIKAINFRIKYLF